MLPQELGTVLALLCAVVLFTTVARRLRLPHPALLALAGILLALVPGLPAVQLAPAVILQVFLPPLLFGAGWRIRWREFRHALRPITILAVGLVLVTTFGVGLAAHLLDPGLPLGAAIVLGAIVSPTDPLASSTVARQVRLPRQIITILEGESLANDATGLVVYRIAVGAMVAGSFSVVGGTYDFLVVASGGIVLGLAVGFVSVRLQRWVDDPPSEFALQLLTGYAAYLPAERLGVSGVFAAAAAGMLSGHHGSYLLGARGRLRATAVWDTLDFLINATLFLVLGLQLRPVLAAVGDRQLGGLILTGLGVSALAIALRLGWMFAGAAVARLRGLPSRPSPGVIALLGWSGMRGVLSLATAIALPETLASGAPFPGRASITFYAFSVIVVTLVVQGLPLPLVIRWLRIPREAHDHEQDRLARLRTALAARDRLDEIIAEGDELTRGLATDLHARYQRLVEHLEAPRPADLGRIQAEILRQRQEVTRAEREALLDLHRRGLIDEETFERMERELDLAEQ